MTQWRPKLQAWSRILPWLAVMGSVLVALTAARVVGSDASMNTWAWPLILLLFCFGVGIIAPVAGVGGGVLYVPLVSAFFPFHIDFVRAAGLLVAMSGSLAAGPYLLRCGLANLRLALPAALIAAVSATAGAHLGFALPDSVVQILLGLLVVGVAVLLLTGRNVEFPVVGVQDSVGARLGLSGSYTEQSSASEVPWRTHRTLPGLLAFVEGGLVAGMFGLGAGWINVPVLNLVMGVPLKVAAGTSNFLIAYVDASAAWVYLHKGAVLPFVVVPSIVGLAAGAAIGARLLPQAKPRLIRTVVVLVLLFAGVKTLYEGILG